MSALNVVHAGNDKELFQKIADGDERAFEAIFHSYNARLLPFVSSITKSREAAEEILQEVFLKLWLRRANLKEIEEPAAWLIRLSSNQALNYLQRLAIHTKVVNRLPIQDKQDGEIEAAIDLKKMQEVINEAVSRLPEKRQQVFKLSREEGFSRKEISDRLNISESTVKNQLTACLKFIREYIEAHHQISLPIVLLLSILKKF